MRLSKQPVNIQFQGKKKLKRKQDTILPSSNFSFFLEKDCLCFSLLFSHLPFPNDLFWQNWSLETSNFVPVMILKVINCICLSTLHSQDLDNGPQLECKIPVIGSLPYFSSDFPESQPSTITCYISFLPNLQKAGRTEQLGFPELFCLQPFQDPWEKMPESR